MDYKTDRAEDVSDLVKKYKMQLDYYEKALEKVTGKRVKEKWIYSFYLGKAIQLNK